MARAYDGATMMYRSAFAFASLALLLACRPSPYSLPDPPPRETWKRVELDPKADQQAGFEAFRTTKSQTMAMYQAIAAQRWSDVVDALSMESRVVLGGGDESRAQQALASGEIRLDGRTVPFEAERLLLLPDVISIVDDPPVDLANPRLVELPSGVSDEDRAAYLGQYESPDRKELFLVTADGGLRKLVWIREAGGWHLHMRSIPLALTGVGP